MEDYAAINFDFILGQDQRVVKKVRYKRSCYKVYFNAQHVLYKLNSLQRSFLTYLIEQSDSQNRIFVDNILKEKYLVFHVGTIKGSNLPGTNSLDKALIKLKKLGLIFSEGTVRANYRINPKYFWTGAESRRITLLKKIVIERAKAGLAFSYLIDCTEGEFLGTVYGSPNNIS